MLCVGRAAREAHLRKHFPRIQVLQEYLLGVNQLLWSEGAADILKSLLFNLAAKLDVLIQTCPLTQDAPQFTWSQDACHLKNKYQLWEELTNEATFDWTVFNLYYTLNPTKYEILFPSKLSFICV